MCSALTFRDFLRRRCHGTLALYFVTIVPHSIFRLVIARDF
jgi:hypothetical protein